MTTKAERKRKSDESPVEFCRRRLAGGNVWDSLAELLKIMKLRGVGKDDVKEVWEIVQPLEGRADPRRVRSESGRFSFRLE